MGGAAHGLDSGVASFQLRQPPLLRFGSGCSRELAEVLALLGLARPLVLTDRRLVTLGHVDRLVAGLERAGIAAAVWDQAEVDAHERSALVCREQVLAGRHDVLVAFGGGSVIDLAKVTAVLALEPRPGEAAFALDGVRRPGLPLVAVPTTAGGGGEVSSHAVIVRELGESSGAPARRKKAVLSGLAVLPRAVLVDPELTLTLPWDATLYPALDGIVHAIEAFLARRAGAWTDDWVRRGLPCILAALPRLRAVPGDLAARETLSLGGVLTGLAMANANAGAIHALGYPLNLEHGIAHGLANALVAAAALRRIAPARPERSAELARCFGARAGEHLAAALARWLAEELGFAPRLADHGICEAELPALARAAPEFGPVLANAPCVLGEADLLAIYRDAFSTRAQRSPP